MFGHKRSIIYHLLIPILLTMLLAFVSSCSEDPTRIQDLPGDNGGLTGSGDVDPGSSGSFLLGTVEDSTFAQGHIEVWADHVVFDDSTGIVSFDVVLLNAMSTPVPAPIHFVIVSVFPANIAVVDFDGVSPDDFPFYDFSMKLGGDLILDPGEQSEPVEMKFHTATARSFSIGFRIDIGPPMGAGKIAGVVFHDNNKNGIRERCKDEGTSLAPVQERCEFGIPGITVAMTKGPFERNTDEVVFITRTNENGEYMFTGLREGVYTVSVHVDPNLWEITSSNPLLVTLVVGPDGHVVDFYGANFGLFPQGTMGEETLFGPIITGPFTPYGALLDTTFIDGVSPLPVIQHYYLEAYYPPYDGPIPVIIDTASVWINDEQVFGFNSSTSPDSIFQGRRIHLRPGLIQVGFNDIRLYVGDNDLAAMWFRVFKTPSMLP